MNFDGTNCPHCGEYARNVTCLSDKRENFACRGCGRTFYGDPVEGAPIGLCVEIDSRRGVVDLQNTSDRVISVPTAPLQRAAGFPDVDPDTYVVNVAPKVRLQMVRLADSPRAPLKR